MKNDLKNFKTLLGVILTVVFVSIGYFEKTDPVKEVSGSAIESDTENDVMSTKKIALTFDDGPHPTYTPLRNLLLPAS